MLINHFKTGWRNLVKNKGISSINIGGLSIGMAVAMLIGLWVWDELSFDKDNRHYYQVAQVMQNQEMNGETGTWPVLPVPLSEALRKTYGSDFRSVVMSSWPETHIVAAGDKKFMKTGNFMEPQGPALMDLRMLSGTLRSIRGPYDVLISRSMASAFFGSDDPMNKIIRMDGKEDMKVAGVYRDLPYNSSFAGVDYVMSWDLKLLMNPWILKMENPWGMNGFRVYVQLADNAGLEQVSKKIRNAKYDRVKSDERRFKPALFLHPMSKWHLYGDFRNGVNTGGRIGFVWLFSIIGIFVLLLACINFMNLSTARSEKRAREVGIRKAVGSLRRQLIGQFFSESLLITALAAIIAIVLVQVLIPFFNKVADKKISILWSNPLFWIFILAFIIITGLIAGSYPALYLSSFRPVKVLKGTFRAGRWAAVPRRVLTVMQFSVSVMLIIGTIVVFRQIEYARDRPLGYDQNGLVFVQQLMPDISDHFDAVKNELLQNRTIVQMSVSGSPLDAFWSTNGGFEWKGKDPSQAVDFPNTGVSVDFGKTVGWQFLGGRDFSREFPTDTAAFIINESAAKFIGFKKPVGEIIKWDGVPFRIIGVIKDLLIESPYAQVRPSFYHLDKSVNEFVMLKLNPAFPPHKALAEIESVFKRYSPSQIFDFRFADEQYAKKFDNEKRIGQLASSFAILAVLISCLGLFGMATFMAEQRTKEIGVRKVLGASVFTLWKLLSRDFVLLVVISLVIAIPLAWYFMHGWLQGYTYRAELSWWIFAAAAAGALIITLATVSYQSVKAALMNPIKSLRTE